MAKTILLTLCLLFAQTSINPVFAFHSPTLQNKLSDECTAPAPDSFRITSIGGNFIGLAWTPAWVGATHTLVVLENNGAGGWITLDTIHDLPGASYTVYGLESGKMYRFIIATNCINGEPSSLKAIIDGIALIVDLAIGGRMPNEPEATTCIKIPLSKNWKGFKVGHNSAGISIANHFEFVIPEGTATGINSFSTPEIRRVLRDHPIVAIDQDKKWPICSNPVRKDVTLPFQIVRLFGSGPDFESIGWIDLDQNSNSISLCPRYNDPDYPWNYAYTFVALVAQTATVLPDCDGRSYNGLVVHTDIKAQSPFGEMLHVFFPQPFSGANKANFRLLNMKGQVVMEQQIELVSSEVAFPFESLASGVYVLQIETELETQTLKVIKR